jgi:hypothetical protein
LEANAHLGPQYRQVVRTLAWQRRATGLAVEQNRPGYVLDALGPVPASTRGRRAWRHAAAEIEQDRRTARVLAALERHGWLCCKVVADGVPVVVARRLPSMLRQLPAVLGPSG